MEKISLSIQDFNLCHSNINGSDCFYLSFFNRYPELIEKNTSPDLLNLFNFYFSNKDNSVDLFLQFFNNDKFSSFGFEINVVKILKNEFLFYLYSSAREIYDFIYEISNQDNFLNIDKIIESINLKFSYDDYSLPWYDYNQNKTNLSIVNGFNIGKTLDDDNEDVYISYFHELLSNHKKGSKCALKFRLTPDLPEQDELGLQLDLAKYYFESTPEEQNLLHYLINFINKELKASNFNLILFLPFNASYVAIITISLDYLKNDISISNPFVKFLLKSLSAFFNRHPAESNLLIKANTDYQMFTLDENNNKTPRYLSEVYGFYFSKDISYGMNKIEVDKFISKFNFNLKIKNIPSNFLVDSSDIYSSYITDKSLSIILGNVIYVDDTLK